MNLHELLSTNFYYLEVLSFDFLIDFSLGFDFYLFSFFTE